MLIRIDDRCLENYIDIIEGIVTPTAEVLANVIECGRKKIKDGRTYYKGEITKQGLKQRKRKSVNVSKSDN